MPGRTTKVATPKARAAPCTCVMRPSASASARPSLLGFGEKPVMVWPLGVELDRPVAPGGSHWRLELRSRQSDWMTPGALFTAEGGLPSRRAPQGEVSCPATSTRRLNLAGAAIKSCDQRGRGFVECSAGFVLHVSTHENHWDNHNDREE